MSSPMYEPVDKFELQLKSIPIAAVTVPAAPPATAPAPAPAPAAPAAPAAPVAPVATLVKENLAGKKRSHSEMEDVQVIALPVTIQNYIKQIETMTKHLLDSNADSTITTLRQEKITLQKYNATQAAEIHKMKARLTDFENQVKVLMERNSQLEAQLAAIRIALGK